MVRPDPVSTKSFLSICAINDIYGYAALAARGVRRGGANAQREPRRRRALRHPAGADGAPPAAGGRARCEALRAHPARHEAHRGRRGLPPPRRQGARQPRRRAAHRERVRARRRGTARARRGAGGLDVRPARDPQALLRRPPARQRQRAHRATPRRCSSSSCASRSTSGSCARCATPTSSTTPLYEDRLDPRRRPGAPLRRRAERSASTRSPASSSSSSTARRATRSSRTRSSAAPASSPRA